MIEHFKWEKRGGGSVNVTSKPVVIVIWKKSAPLAGA